MGTLVNFVLLIRSTIMAFFKALEHQFADKADPRGICGFGEWVHFFTFDIVSELTLSKRLGFVGKGIYIEGIIQKLEEAFAYFVVVGILQLL
jgi:hypothetical protein